MIFTDTAVSYGDTEIRYDDATGIAFHSLNISGTVNSSDGFIGIRSPSKHIKIKIRCRSGFFGFKSLKNNYEEICSTAFEHLASPITNKLIRKITGGGSFQIGNLTFDATGITANGLFGRSKRVTWELRPEVKEIHSNFLWMSSVSGYIAISYFYPPTGQIISIAATSSRTENGCLVPALIRQMNEIHNGRKA